MSESVVPSPVLMVRARSLILATRSSAMGPTATAAEMAMQRSPAEPNPALTMASCAARADPGVDHGVGGQVQVGVGQDHGVVLGSAQGLDAFTRGGAGGV